jgi:hypothetical protein
MSRDAPGHPTRFSDAEFIAKKVRAVGFVCRMLATSDQLVDYGEETGEIMWLLGDLLNDYGVRMELQGEEADKALDKAHITVAKATTAKAVA